MVNKFRDIYDTLKNEINEGLYNDTMVLPTEMALIERFGTSRNTVRRAIQLLNEEGLVYSVRGRGVVILERIEIDKKSFKVGNFQGLKALSSDAEVEKKTIVQEFRELTVDDSLAKKISFPVGERVYLVKRLRIIDGKAMMSDTSYFKKSIVKGLNEKIIAGSIYDHIRQNLDFKIAASKSIMKVESAKDSDFKELALGKNNCVGILENAVYNDMGKLFEYTTIRYIPNEYALISFDQT